MAVILLRRAAVVGFLCLCAPVFSEDPAHHAGEVVLEATTIKHPGGEYAAEKGRLWVPMDRARPNSRLLELAFIRLRCTGQEAGSPIFYLAGGPGEPATRQANFPSWQTPLQNFDLVFLDQRGCGASKPMLIYSPPESVAASFFGDSETSLRVMTETARDAAKQFASQGIDLGAFNTRAIAADVDDLRKALGYKRISLIGHSYGTHLGLEVVRKFADHIDRFVSVGTAGTGDMHRLPADLDESLRNLSRNIAANPEVGKDVPDFEALLRSTLEKLKIEPIHVTVMDQEKKADIDVAVSEAGLKLIVLHDLSDVEDVVVLPRLVYEVAHGETATLRWFVQKRYSQLRVLPVMTLAVRGASGASAKRWELIRQQAPTSVFGMARVVPPLEVAEALGVRDLGESFRTAVVSKVPTLFVSGTLDANTPPEQTEEVRRNFANSGHIIVENGGHEDLLGNNEVREALWSFLKGGAPQDMKVTAPPLRFIPVKGSAKGHPSVE